MQVLHGILQGMSVQADYERYAAKMRQLVLAGVDMETEARFIDMLCNRNSRILDIGCGIGTTVSALRRKGHLAFGIDPTDAVLEIARELYKPGWYAKLSATELAKTALKDGGFPLRFEVILLSGNVPFFLTEAELASLLEMITSMLLPGGQLVIGTTTKVRGGPEDQDRHAQGIGLTLQQRYANWHLEKFVGDSAFSVSIFDSAGQKPPVPGPDGLFVLRG